MNWILTSTGKRFDLFEPDADMIDPRDISHSLAHLCRFNGHTREFYSVAQHSCICRRTGAGRTQTRGLTS